MPNVLFLINQTPPLAGIQNFLLNLLQHIDHSRFQCTVINFIALPDFQDRLRGHPIRVMTLNKKPGHDVKFMFTLKRAIAATEPDIIQTHNWGTLVEGIIAGRMAGVTRFVHAERGTLNLRGVNIYIQRWLWHCVDRVLCVSDMHKQTMHKAIGFPSGKIMKIANGVDTLLYRPDPVKRKAGRRLLELEDDDFCIGAVGHLRSVKNHQLLVESLPKVKHNGQRLRVCLVGDGPERQRLEQLSRKLGIGGMVKFCGTQENIPSILNAMDVYVLPSLSEGLSNSLLEAMSCQLPVVASAVGGNVEVVEPGVSGMLFESGNSHHLASVLTEMVLNGNRRTQIGRRARKRVAEMFSLTGMVRAYESLYDSLICRAPSALPISNLS